MVWSYKAIFKTSKKFFRFLRISNMVINMILNFSGLTYVNRWNYESWSGPIFIPCYCSHSNNWKFPTIAHTATRLRHANGTCPPISRGAMQVDLIRLGCQVTSYSQINIFSKIKHSHKQIFQITLGHILIGWILFRSEIYKLWKLIGAIKNT